MSLARAEPAVRRPAGVDRPTPPGRRRTRPRLRAVAARPARPSRWAFVLLAAVLAGGLLVAVVAAQALVAQNSFRQQAAQATIQDLQQTNAELRLRAAQDSAPGRIAEEARKLGFRLPDPSEVFTLPIAPPASGRAGTRTPSFPQGVAVGAGP